MKFDNLKTDKGIAGLTILLSLVTMLFVIGLLVMIFSLMAGELRSGIATSVTYTGLQQNITITDVTTDNILTACIGLIDGAIASTVVINVTGNTLDPSLITILGCGIAIEDIDTGHNETVVDVTYSATTSGAAGSVINDTSGAISSVTDWFAIFIVIGAMVVLILLTVIIITAIRGSGMMGGTQGGESNQGYA